MANTEPLKKKSPEVIREEQRQIADWLNDNKERCKQLTIEGAAASIWKEYGFTPIDAARVRLAIKAKNVDVTFNTGIGR